MRITASGDRFVIVPDTNDCEEHLRFLADRRCNVRVTEDCSATTQPRPSGPSHPTAAEVK